jgi:hypothetical protein
MISKHDYLALLCQQNLPNGIRCPTRQLIDKFKRSSNNVITEFYFAELGMDFYINNENFNSKFYLTFIIIKNYDLKM